MSRATFYDEAGREIGRGVVHGIAVRRQVFSDPQLAAQEVSRRAVRRIQLGTPAVDALDLAVQEYLADCRGRMRGRDLYRLQDHLTGGAAPTWRSDPRACAICGGAPADGWAASAGSEECLRGPEHLCAPCGLWALAFERWDDAIEQRRAEAERAVPIEAAICPPV